MTATSSRQPRKTTKSQTRRKGEQILWLTSSASNSALYSCNTQSRTSCLPSSSSPQRCLSVLSGWWGWISCLRPCSWWRLGPSRVTKRVKNWGKGRMIEGLSRAILAGPTRPCHWEGFLLRERALVTNGENLRVLRNSGLIHVCIILYLNKNID